MKSPKVSLKSKFGYTRAELTLLIDVINTLLMWAKTKPQHGFHVLSFQHQIASISTHVGICHNMQALLNTQCLLEDHKDAFSLVARLAQEWPESVAPGQYRSWPVKNTVDFHLWEGPNLTGRIRLLRFLRKRLRYWLRWTKE